jgi:type III restriction enzyme
MPQTVIENPVINSPFTEPSRHYFFNDGGITDKIVPNEAGGGS